MPALPIIQPCGQPPVRPTFDQRDKDGEGAAVPDWFATLAGWMSLGIGGLGLLRGATLLLHGGKDARDTTGTPGQLVLVESGGLTLLGAAALLGGGWVHLVWPALFLISIGELRRIRRWLHRRRHRPLLSAHPDEHAG